MKDNKLRNKSDHHGEDKKKKKEISPATSGTKAIDSKMDDMNKIIKNLSAKISRLEMENKNQNKHVQYNDNKNPNQFRRAFNPRFFPRDRKTMKIEKYNLLSKII